MKVVQFSMTPLAGAPIRIAKAVNSHTDVHVRHVDLKRWNIFEHDHIHIENPDLTLDLCNSADIIHLYNYVHIDSTDFHPVNFRELQKRGKIFIWQFESTPMLVSKMSGLTIEEITNSKIPKLVIAQYPERFLNTAMIVPNIIPEMSDDYMPDIGNNIIDVIYTPSKTISSWDSRWDTKGMPETMKVLNKLTHNINYNIKILNNKPHKEIMKAKQKSRIVVDELITGSYHLSGLEGLSCGKPTLAYLDHRTDYVLREISGSNICPFINVRLEDSYSVIKYLLENPEVTRELGLKSRKWIEKYWNEAKLSNIYADIYYKLLNNPSLIKRQSSLKIDGKDQKFFSVDSPDIIYNARATNYYLRLNIIEKMHILLSKQYQKIIININLLKNYLLNQLRNY